MDKLIGSDYYTNNYDKPLANQMVLIVSYSNRMSEYYCYKNAIDREVQKFFDSSFEKIEKIDLRIV